MVRLRSLAYRGDTHDVLHNAPITESSLRRIAEDKRKDLAKPNTWHWKIVDTDSQPSQDDPKGNGGRTIAVAVWSMHNMQEEGSNEASSVPAEVADTSPGYLPPELRLDALKSLFDPLRAAQDEIMGTTKSYFMLNSLATHPDHQRRGAGKILLDWGVKKADDEHLITYLDCSSVARPMYEKAGFKLVRGYGVG